MSFQFESKAFKKTFDEVLKLASLVLNNIEKYPETLVEISKEITSLEKVFNTDRDLSNYDKNIVYSPQWDRFDFVYVISQELNKYKIESDIKILTRIIFLSASLIYIYLKELLFVLGGLSPDIGIEVGRYESVVRKNLKDNLEYSRYIDYGDRDLSFQILRDILHSQEIRNFQDLRFKVIDAQQQVDNWVNNFEQRKNQVLELEKRLDSSKTQYDFILLNQGFKSLYSQKENELTKPRSNSRLIFWLILAIPFLEILFFGYLIYSKVPIDPIAIWYFIIPSISLILFLFYFYRINISNNFLEDCSIKFDYTLKENLDTTQLFDKLSKKIPIFKNYFSFIFIEIEILYYL